MSIDQYKFIEGKKNEIDIVKKSLNKLNSYCQINKYQGYDPYDFLSSNNFKFLPSSSS